MSKKELEYRYVPFVKLVKNIYIYKSKNRCNFLIGSFDGDGKFYCQGLIKFNQAGNLPWKYNK